MQFPKRVEQHVVETASSVVFRSKMPPLWIIRDMTERDYGIDIYMELVSPKGEVMGDLCSVQLKGQESIDWQTDTESNPVKATMSINMSTIKYWMGLPVPVILVVADVTGKSAYFAAVKAQVRGQYDKYDKQDSMTFSVHHDTELGTPEGMKKFLIAYYQERQIRRFHILVKDVLTHAHEYMDFILEKALSKEVKDISSDKELVMFTHISDICIFLGKYFAIHELHPSRVNIYEQEEHMWERGHIAGLGMQIICKNLIRPYVQIIAECLTRVYQDEQEYWRRSERPVHLFAAQLDANEFKKKAKLK